MTSDINGEVSICFQRVPSKDALSANAGDFGVQSFNLNQLSDVTSNLSGLVEATIYSTAGVPLDSCVDICTKPSLLDGGYFVVLYYLETTNNASLLVSW